MNEPNQNTSEFDTATKAVAEARQALADAIHREKQAKLKEESRRHYTSRHIFTGNWIIANNQQEADGFKAQHPTFADYQVLVFDGKAHLTFPDHFNPEHYVLTPGVVQSGPDAYVEVLAAIKRTPKAMPR